jgi:hypothetical protein
MQIIKSKQYDNPLDTDEKENKTLRFISYNSNGTLSFVMQDGTHYNFIDKEAYLIFKFIRDKIKC